MVIAGGVPGTTTFLIYFGETRLAEYGRPEASPANLPFFGNGQFGIRFTVPYFVKRSDYCCGIPINMTLKC